MVIICILLGAVCIFFLQIWVYRKFWYKNLTASVKFVQHAITENEEGELLEIITNQKWLPLPMLRVQFELDRHLEFLQEGNVSVTDRCYKNDIFSLMMYQKITRRLKFRGTRRGFYSISQMDLDSTDLFMEEKLGMRIPCSTSIYVYPGQADTKRLLVPFQKMMGDILTRRYTYEDPFEFQGIRPYQPFDNMRDVNWKASARTGELRTNIHGFTVRQEVCILLNLESESVLEDRLLKEESIRLANSLTELFLIQKIPAGLYCNAKDLLSNEVLLQPPGSGEKHLLTIRERLARLDLSQPVEDFGLFCKQNNFSDPADILYVLICSSQRKEVKDTFRMISKNHPESLWIMPVHQAAKYSPEFEKELQIMYWEVDLHAK